MCFPSFLQRFISKKLYYVCLLLIMTQNYYSGLNQSTSKIVLLSLHHRHKLDQLIILRWKPHHEKNMMLKSLVQPQSLRNFIQNFKSKPNLTNLEVHLVIGTTGKFFTVETYYVKWSQVFLYLINSGQGPSFG